MISRDREQEKQEIKEGLKARIENLCAQLLPDGRRQGRLWVAHNPITQDYSQSPEFKVALNRDTGAWKDWRTGEKGDVLRLVEYCQATDFAGAMTWSRDFLGLRSMGREERERFNNQMRAARERAERDAEQIRIRRMQAAERLFLTGFADGEATTAEAHARAYFKARGCPIGDIVNRDLTTFRFASAAEYWKRAEYRHENGRRRKVKDGPRFPAVLSAMRAPTGQITAVHCTFLDPVLPKKLSVEADENAKMMFGEAKGSMIRISHGPEGLPPETARQAYPLVLCEGVEDGLSLALAIPEARVWAAGSLSAMASAPVDLPCISAVIVSQDNDWHSKTAQAQFEAVLAQLEQAGRPVTTIASHIGKDFNDLMKGDE